MNQQERVRTLAEMTAQHPEVAVELLDSQGRVRIILFNGMSHPECLPTGGKSAMEHDDPVQAVVAANVYPRELYENAALVDYEPIATGVSLSEAIQVIAED